MLVFPGALGVADWSGEVLSLLAAQRRVLVFDYGLERQAEPLFARVLASIGAEPVDVLGFSIGGWLGQCLAARAPERVRKLVLAHSFVLDPTDAWRFSLARFLWPMLPPPVFRAAATRRARAALAPLREARPEAFETAMRAVTAALIAVDAKAKLVAQQQAVCDSLAGFAPPPAEVLIIDSDDDPVVPRAAQARLAATYPNAVHVTLANGGHSGALLDPEGFATAVDRFLQADTG